MCLLEWREFRSAPCLAGRKLDDGSRLDVVEIARALTCFRACFLRGWAKDVSAPGYWLRKHPVFTPYFDI